MGNNEVVGPFGAGTVFQEFVPSSAAIRANLWVKKTAIGQMFGDLAHSGLGNGRTPRHWEGMEMFSRTPVRADDARLPTVYERGVKLESEGNHREAIPHFEQAAVIDNEFANLRFRWGRCYWETEQFDKAGEQFTPARDLDVLRFRADRNARPNQREALSEQQCAERLAFTDWNRYKIADQMFDRIQQSPFTNQLDHVQQVERAREQLDELRIQSRQPQVAERARTAYQRALRQQPNDLHLRENFADLLESQGDLPAAVDHLRLVVSRLPHRIVARHQLGMMLTKLGRHGEAAAQFDEALEIRSDAATHNYLGMVLCDAGKFDDALAHFTEALRIQPDFRDAQSNLQIAQRKRTESAHPLATP